MILIENFIGYDLPADVSEVTVAALQSAIDAVRNFMGCNW